MTLSSLPPCLPLEQTEPLLENRLDSIPPGRRLTPMWLTPGLRGVSGEGAEGETCSGFSRLPAVAPPHPLSQGSLAGRS